MSSSKEKLSQVLLPIHILLDKAREDFPRIAKSVGLPISTLDAIADGQTPGLGLEDFVAFIDYYGLELRKTSKRKTTLNTTLAELGLNCSSRDFQVEVIDAFQDGYPDTTVDDLITNPKEAMRFCLDTRSRLSEKGICSRLGRDKIPDHLILRSLFNARKDPTLPRIYRKRTRSESLAKSLQQFGIDATRESFIEFLQDSFASMYKSKTLDELLVYPAEAEQLCIYLRKLLGNKSVPSSFLLKTLMNARKAINS
jgi:hypothetical protein